MYRSVQKVRNLPKGCSSLRVPSGNRRCIKIRIIQGGAVHEGSKVQTCGRGVGKPQGQVQELRADHIGAAATCGRLNTALHLEPQNVILFGNKVYYRCKDGKDGEIILDCGGPSIQCKRQKRIHRDREGDHLKTEAESAVIGLQTLSAASRSYQKSTGLFLLKNLQKEPILTTP